MDKIKKTSISKVFKEFSGRYPKQFGLLFFLLIIEGTVAAFSLLALVPMADFIMDPSLVKPSKLTQFVVSVFSKWGWTSNFWKFGALFIAFNLLKGILEVLIKYAILRIKYDVTRGLLGDTLTSFFKARWGFFSGEENGRLLNTMNKELIIVGDTLGHLATFLAQIIQVCIYVAVPIWLSPTITLTTLGLCILFGSPFLLLHRVSYRLGKENNSTANEAMRILNELLQAARLVLGFGRQNQARIKYLNAFDKHTRVTFRAQTLQAAIPKFFMPLCYIAAVIAMGQAIDKKVPVSELAAVMWSLLAALPILATLLQSNITISNFLPSYEQLVALRKTAEGFEEIEGGLIFNTIRNNIEFKDVFFTYPGRKQTLTGINLTIQKGSMTALVGHSGSGKSTITDLLLGLQIPEKGDVLIDGVPLRNFKQNSFRERIGYVPQDPMLFHASIRENLLWAFDKANENDLWHALRLANAEVFVKELPEGIDTLVGDRGVRLSGGQRQRIALARALLRKPELLILDEATSSLDTESERLIQHSIDEVAKDTTILVIAHRLSTIEKANTVYVINMGSVLEHGSFSDLSQNRDSTLSMMLAVQQPLEIR